MLVTDKFVFLHLPRAGGTFVYEVVRKFFPSAREIGYHFPRELLPKEYSHLPILGTVRNPWEFYVSWYHHHHSSDRYSPSKNVLFGSVSEDRKLDFAQTIRNALTLGVNDDKLDLLIQALPENFDYQKTHIPNLTKDVMRRLQGTGIGLYTFRFNQLFGQADDVFFCRVESLRSDLMTFFEKIGAASDALRSYVLGLEKKNSSEHLHYSSYYTPELAELVSTRDRQLVDRFGFIFEGYASGNKGGGQPLERLTRRATPAPVSLDEHRKAFEAGLNNLLHRTSSMTEPSMPRKVGRACGKIILSGNTANRFGKRALAVPVDMYITATWDKSYKPEERFCIVWPGQKENDLSLATARKITKLIEAQIGPLSGKLTIRNTLPLGKGMGSSTAIVVALARCFLGENCKEEALAIEDIINKGHSGLDFAAIWEERPILIKKDSYEFTDLPKGLQHGFLVDTGLPAEPTSMIVGRLKDRLREEALMDFVETIGNCTERLLSGEDPLTVFPDHYTGFVKLGVMPPRVRLLIEKIQQSGGAAKAARFGAESGGAGMVFAVHPKVNVLKKIVGGAPISLVYDPSLRRFISRTGHNSKPS